MAKCVESDYAGRNVAGRNTAKQAKCEGRGVRKTVFSSGIFPFFILSISAHRNSFFLNPQKSVFELQSVPPCGWLTKVLRDRWDLCKRTTTRNSTPHFWPKNNLCRFQGCTGKLESISFYGCPISGFLALLPGNPAECKGFRSLRLVLL